MIPRLVCQAVAGEAFVVTRSSLVPASPSALALAVASCPGASTTLLGLLRLVAALTHRTDDLAADEALAQAF